MRLVPLLVVAAWTLSSCTTIVVGDTHVWGRTKDVSLEDIRAALAVAAAAQLSNGKTPEAQVISRDEIHVFFERGGGNCVVVKRIQGKWRPGGYILITS
jgi:hypothetical protein